QGRLAGGRPLLTPADLHAPTHARARGDGERAGLEIAVEDSGGEELDALRALDVPLDLAADRDGARPHAAGELRAGVDREVALDVDVPLEAAGDADVPRAVDLAGDRDVGGDHRLLHLARRGPPGGRGRDVRGE